MTKFDYLRPFLHAVYLVIAAAAALIGTLHIGVPATGDNPGAVAFGLLAALGTYVVLLSSEVFIESYIRDHFTFGKLLLVSALTLLSALFSLQLTTYSLYLTGKRYQEPAPMVAVAAITFLTAEWMIRLGLQFLIAALKTPRVCK